MVITPAHYERLWASVTDDQDAPLHKDIEEGVAEVAALIAVALFFVRSRVMATWPAVSSASLFPQIFLERTMTMLRRRTAKAYRRAFRAALDTLRVADRPSDAQGLAAFEASLAPRLAGFAETMDRIVRDRLHRMARDGASPERVRRELEQLFVERFRTTHARRLLRTELTRAVNTAIRTATSLASPSQALVWRNTDAPNVCPACRARNYTIQAETPPLHPNCRCRLVPEGT
jgi:SPP1 gp7 family putative phage head morphogenesis protein